jgi:hypothetical protein
MHSTLLPASIIRLTSVWSPCGNMSRSCFKLHAEITFSYLYMTINYWLLFNNERISAEPGAKLFKGDVIVVKWEKRTTYTWTTKPWVRGRGLLRFEGHIWVGGPGEDAPLPLLLTALTVRMTYFLRLWKWKGIQRNIHLPYRFERLTKYDIFLDRSIH